MSAIAVSERAKTAVQLGESHFREFKSGVQGLPGAKAPRPKKDIAADIARTLVAFANADGGELLVGVEDNGEVTGLSQFAVADLQYLEQSYKERIHEKTPLAAVRVYRVEIDGQLVLYFSVSKSTEYVHLTSDGRCLQRKDLESLPVAAEEIIFDRRERKSREYDREFVDGVDANELNVDLVRAVSDQLIKGMSAEKCLQYLELGEYGLSQLRLRRAALLLFAKNPARWHPRLQLRIVKVDGEFLKTGEEYNVVADETISGNILELVEKGWEALRPHLVQTRIDKSARFEQRSIYPELACREALLNAIAHRDYSEEGRGIEVYVFDSHLEVRNPGALLSTIKLSDITAQKGMHQSRNTHVSRVLRELGYMRELGEGMRRIFDLMQRNELAAPALESGSDGFRITLKHKPIYSEKDMLWLGQFENPEFDREHKAVILLGQAGRVFSAQEIWDAVGIVDTEHYRKLVDTLLRTRVLVNRVNKMRAKREAQSKKIPFREMPRFGVEIPSEDPIPRGRPGRKARQQKFSEVPDLSNRLYVGNLPRSVGKADLFDAFSFFDEVKEIDLPGNGMKGFAVVELGSAAGAKAALAANNLEFEGRKLVVRPAVSKRALSGPQRTVSERRTVPE